MILLKIFSIMTLSKGQPGSFLSQNKLAAYLCMSVSEVNAATKRLHNSGLIGRVFQEGTISNKPIFLPIKAACEECLVSGVKYFFPVQLGTYTRGIATSYAAPIFAKYLLKGDDPIPVWPYAEGDQRGLALEPLYPSIPDSLAQYPDTLFYELLTLLDAIRSGRARERDIAIKLLREKINYEPPTLASNL